MRPLPAMTVELAELVRSLRDDPVAAGRGMRRVAGILRARWLFRRCDLGEGLGTAGLSYSSYAELKPPGSRLLCVAGFCTWQ